ncbi:DUF2087 domain-containing protein [Brachybacterium sp. AOP25-B2-12]|uniref:DUF2087 domain-containing protein n=1 Tax=Brachybacterium sp. AOP25-B2-12 TaxID=3457710 RepID=UPI004033DCE4
MTTDRDFKRVVRARSARTGESYTAARAALIAERAVDPALLPTSAPSAPGAARTERPDPHRARAEHERLLRPFVVDGRIVQIPARRRPLFALLLELLARFVPGETVSEREVGQIIGPVHEDVAFWRRELVDYGLLCRDSLGTYWVTDTLPLREGNAVQEQTDWEHVWLPAFLARASRGSPDDVS